MKFRFIRDVKNFAPDKIFISVADPSHFDVDPDPRIHLSGIVKCSGSGSATLLIIVTAKV